MESGKIIVFGSFNTDLSGRASRLPKPGETIFGTSFSINAGGKGANQCVAASRAGAKVTMVAKLGRDMFADIALNLFREEGIDCGNIFRDDTNSTGASLVAVNETTGQNSIIVFAGANFNVTPDDVRSALPALAGADILLTQLENNFDATVSVISAAHFAGVTVVLNPAPARELPEGLYSMLDLITPNEYEAEVLTGIPSDSEDNIRKSAEVLLKRGAKAAVITLGSRGLFAADGKEGRFIKAVPLGAPVVDTTGAGDCFAGSLAAALSEGKGLFEACEFASAAAAISCRRAGAAVSMPRREEIEKVLAEFGGSF